MVPAVLLHSGSGSVCVCMSHSVIFSLQLARVGPQRDWGQRGPFRDPVQSGQCLVLCRWCSVVTLRLTRSREKKTFPVREGRAVLDGAISPPIFPSFTENPKAMAKGQPCAACSLVFWDITHSWSAKKTDARCIFSPHHRQKSCRKTSLFFLTWSVHKWDDFNGNN